MTNKDEISNQFVGGYTADPSWNNLMNVLSMSGMFGNNNQDLEKRFEKLEAKIELLEKIILR